jgi:hypothetical protein
VKGESSVALLFLGLLGGVIRTVCLSYKLLLSYWCSCKPDKKFSLVVDYLSIECSYDLNLVH